MVRLMLSRARLWEEHLLPLSGCEALSWIGVGVDGYRFVRLDMHNGFSKPTTSNPVFSLDYSGLQDSHYLKMISVLRDV